MAANTPKTIPEYLDQLRAALRDADPALVQDALYDAEEYLRSELAEHPDKSEAQMLAEIAGSYGAPEEVAEIYRDTEVKVNRALRTPPPPPPRTALGRFFGVALDPRTYTALIYMLLSLATGILYFTTVVTGLSLSLGLSILIVGIPFVILFVGITRLLSLAEGRIVEALLGQRMPRRPLYAQRGKPLLARIGTMFTDPRTWSTMLYMLLMLPLGIAYFTFAVASLSVSLGLIVAPVLIALAELGWIDVYAKVHIDITPLSAPLAFVLGVLLLFVSLHIVRGVGRVHAEIAKGLLVKTAQH